MSSIASIATVQVTTGSAGVPRTPFSKPLLFANFAGGTQLKEYGSLSEVAADHSTTSAPYYMAAALLADPVFKPSKFLIGRRSTEVAQVVRLTFAGDFVSGNTITATVNGTAISVPWNSDHDTTGTDVAAAILALGSISAAVWTNTSPSPTGGYIDVTGNLNDDVYGGGVTITDPAVTGGASQATGSSATTTALVNAVTDLTTLAADLGLSGDWYAFASDLRTDSRIRLMATWAASNSRFYAAQSDTAAIYDADDSTDIGSLLSTAANDYVALTYYSSDAVYVDCAWLGRYLAIDLDNEHSITRFARLQSTDYNDLTTSQESALEGKNVNYYSQLQRKKGAFQKGVTSAGNRIDQRMGLDWIRLRTSEDLVGALVDATARGSKIPHTPSGYDALGTVALQRMLTGVRTGLLTDEPLVQTDGSVIDRKPRVEVVTPSAADRTARRVSFNGFAYLAGAIEQIQLFSLTLEV